jgi:hypothetical protein
MNRKISSEKSKSEMEKRLIEIDSLIEETKACMIEINTNYQKSNGGINSDKLQEEFELKDMLLDNLLQKKSEIETTLLLAITKGMMKPNFEPKILRLAPDTKIIDKIYFGTLIIVCIGAILSLLLGWRR